MNSGMNKAKNTFLFFLCWIFSCSPPKKISKYLLKHEKESTCDEDENESQVEDPRLSCHHNPAIAVEFIPPRENLPLPLDRLPLARRLHWRRAASADPSVFALSFFLGFTKLHVLCGKSLQS